MLDLLDRFGAPHPHPDATHYFGTLGKTSSREQHTEFVTYTLFREGVPERAFDPAEFEAFPADWLDVHSTSARDLLIMQVEMREDDGVIVEKVQEWFLYQKALR